MRDRPRRGLLPLLLLPCFACVAAESATLDSETPGEGQEAMNVLSEEEAAEGFVLLFDGESLEAWRGFRRDDAPAGWSASEGTLHFAPGVESGDIMTRETFTDFDLRLEWRLAEGGNSGIFFGISETSRRSYHGAPEMQVLDNDRHPDGANPLTSAGANYALHAPPEDVTRPIGEWNEVRIVRHQNRVVHWLNGVEIVEYELGSDEWAELVAGSKFAEWPEYGTFEEGHIGLQDHGDPVWYRNIRIRRL